MHIQQVSVLYCGGRLPSLILFLSSLISCIVSIGDFCFGGRLLSRTLFFTSVISCIVSTKYFCFGGRLLSDTFLYKYDLKHSKHISFPCSGDRLLALGMQEYDRDWERIRLRFLPTKTAQQIAVRVKNRCSHLAPDNAIKQVRDRKASKAFLSFISDCLPSDFEYEPTLEIHIHVLNASLSPRFLQNVLE
jgi:hypothetical protein